MTAGLQPAPFVRSGTDPRRKFRLPDFFGAGGGALRGGGLCPCHFKLVWVGAAGGGVGINATEEEHCLTQSAASASRQDFLIDGAV